MAVTLRDYQVRTLDQVWAALQVKLNVLISAPCAAGKTIMFSKIVQRLLRENPAFRALILTDREILVTQSRDKLAAVAPELAADIGIACSSVTADRDLSRRVTIASRQTLVNHLDRFEPVQLVIVDECHLMAIPTETKPEPDQFAAIIGKLRAYNQNMRMVGCTASPYRLNTGYIFGSENRPGSRPYFDQIDAQITTTELLAGGYIAPLTGRVNTSAGLEEDLRNVNVIGGEYNLGQVSMAMCKASHVQTCIDAWRLYAGDRKKTLVFCCTIEHAEAVAKAFSDAGIPATAIHSKLTQVEESVRFSAMERGTLQVFTSVAKLTTGMDVVDLDCGILARPTKSTALYKQMVGRFQRTAPGKTDALILDLVGATTEFGTDMDNLRVNVPRGDGEGGEAVVKICPGTNPDGTVCGISVHASLKYCPACGYEFPVAEAVEAKIGALKKVEFNAAKEPDIYEVASVYYEIHESRKTGKSLIKVGYFCGIYSTFNEWICLPDFYQGYAVDKARDWWEARTEEPFPSSVEEFIFLSDSLVWPTHVAVVEDGKFNRVVECMFAEIGDQVPDEMPVEHALPDDCEVPF